MVVKANTFSHAAIDLGLIPDGQTQSNAAIPDHAADFITAGPHNDIIIHGRDPSSPIDGVQVVFTHASTGVDYNENTRILTVGLTAGETAAQAVDRINNSAAGTLFAAYLDPTDCSSGLGLVADNALPYTMAGGSGTTRSAVTAVIPGLDNDLIFNSVGNGTVYNNYDINFVDIPGSGAIAFTHTALPTDVLTINYDSTAVGMRTANDVVAAWSNAANWIPPADPMRTGVSVRIDRTDGPPNIGDGVVGNPTGTLDPLTTGVTVLTGEDVHPLETEGIFSAILRLRDALNSDDVQGVQRAIDELLDPATTNMNYTRASLGARQQGLEVVQSRLATEYVELKVSLSDNHDADLAQVVSDMASRQVAYEASLMAMGKIMQMSLLNYL
jgi:flagellin-like hook-associated protein FlgL